MQYAADQWQCKISEPSKCNKDILTPHAYKVNELSATCWKDLGSVYTLLSCVNNKKQCKI